MSTPLDSIPAESFDPTFLHFDPYEGALADITAYIPQHIALADDTISTPSDVEDIEDSSISETAKKITGKGKAVSQPVDIRSKVCSEVVYDLFDISPSSSSSNRTSATLPQSDPSTLSPVYLDIDRSILDDRAFAARAESSDYKGKGKGKQTAPTLPPLSFSREDWDWPQSQRTAGPSSSSYTSGLESLPIALSSPVAKRQPTTHLASSSSAITPSIPRRKSLSNVSIHSAQSNTTLSLSRVKVKFAGPSSRTSNLARKLLLTRRPDEQEAINACVEPTLRMGVTPVLPPFAALDLVDVQKQVLPLHYNARALLTGKKRSYSSPLPFSAFDIASATPPVDTFLALPIVIRNYFDKVLPRELQLHIFQCVVQIAVLNHEQVILDGRWTAVKSCTHKNRWVGKDAGLRTLIIISRVSKLWRSLAFDGQLWTQLDLRSFPQVPPSLLSQIAETGGSFVHTLNLAGHTGLRPDHLLRLANDFCITPPPSGRLSCTQLTSIDLQGCSLLTTRSLHHLLLRCPVLERLNLKGLGSVTNTTFDLLAHCPRLRYLDVGRCPNMTADGIKSMAVAALNRGEHLLVKELRMSGLKHVTDSMMAALGKAAPALEVLDLSYARQLHNSSMEAFVAVADNDEEDVSVSSYQIETVILSARQVGRDSSDLNKYHRRVTRLRHLNLSSCILLSDNACSSLAYTMPRLEILELAGIGADLKDDGLIRLLETTPLIRRLDLEDASDITDTMIAAITPATNSLPPTVMTCRAPESGLALEHLIISYASRVTDAAILGMVQACSRLSKLEVDNTRISGATVKEFIRRRSTIAADMTSDSPDAYSRIVAVDCRGVGEQLVKSVGEMVRPRRGRRSYDARKLGFVDGRDIDPDTGLYEDLRKAGLLKSGGLQDECDERRVVLKTFYGWQSVDAIAAVREKRRKSLRGKDSSAEGSARSTRWWTPGASGSRRSASGSISRVGAPSIVDMNDRDACVIA